LALFGIFSRISPFLAKIVLFRQTVFLKAAIFFLLAKIDTCDFSERVVELLALFGVILLSA
jgi:hypothetical protein